MAVASLPRRPCNSASESLPLIEVEPTEGLVDELDCVCILLGHDNRTLFAANAE